MFGDPNSKCGVLPLKDGSQSCFYFYTHECLTASWIVLQRVFFKNIFVPPTVGHTTVFCYLMWCFALTKCLMLLSG